MRKDSIDSKALENAYLIYAERGHKIVDYDFSHQSTDYYRGTVVEPEHTSKLRDAFNELAPTVRNQRFNAMSSRDEEIESRVAELQSRMRVSRERGNFQMLQSQMKEMNALMKEKERIDAAMAVENLGAAQTDVYDDTMDPEFAEMEDISARIASLEQRLHEYRESLGE